MSTATIEKSAIAIATPQSADAIRQMVRRVTTIATLPEITVQIIKIVEDPRSSAAQLHRIVSHDPALVTRILKVVNSSFYSLPTQVGSVERAIVMLGLNAIKNIAVAASIGQMFRGVKLCEGFTAKDLWKHCVAVGVVARDLAKTLHLPLADEAFLAGMIHDVGILVALQISPEALRSVCDKARRGPADFDFCRAERETMGYDHQQLGETLADIWKFPRACQLVAGHHHRIADVEAADRELVGIVHLADTLCAQAQQGFNLTAKNQSIETAAAELGISMDVIEAVRSRIPTLVGDASLLS